MKKFATFGLIAFLPATCLFASCSCSPTTTDSISLSWQNDKHTLDQTTTTIVANAIPNIKNYVNPPYVVWNVQGLPTNVTEKRNGNSIEFTINSSLSSIAKTVNVSCSYNSIKSNVISFNVAQFTVINYDNELIFTTTPSNTSKLDQTNSSITLKVEIRSKNGGTLVNDYVSWTIDSLPGFINYPTPIVNTNELTFTLKNNESTVQGSYVIQASYNPTMTSGAATKSFVLETETHEYWDPSWIPRSNLIITNGTRLDGVSGNFGSATILHTPKEITSIKTDAFQGDDTNKPLNGITNIDFSECINLKSIGEAAFQKSSTTFTGALVLPSSLISMQMYAFDALTFSTIDMRPCSNLKSLPAGCFATNSNLEHIYFNNNLEKTESATGEGAGVFHIADGISKFNDTLVLPANLQSIGDFTFNGLDNNSQNGGGSSITLDFSQTTQLRSIGYSAFASTYLNNNTNPLTFPNTLTSIDGLAFSSAKNIKRVIIPSSVSSIGRVCFINSDIQVLQILKTNAIYPYDISEGSGQYSNKVFGKWLRTTDIEPYTNGQPGPSINGAHVEVPSALLQQYKTNWPSWIDIR